MDRGIGESALVFSPRNHPLKDPPLIAEARVYIESVEAVASTERLRRNKKYRYASALVKLWDSRKI